MTTALTDNKKLLNICRASSDAREFAKLMKEQYTAAHAAHFIRIISPHILKIIPIKFK